MFLRTEHMSTYWWLQYRANWPRCIKKPSLSLSVFIALYLSISLLHVVLDNQSINWWRQQVDLCQIMVCDHGSSNLFGSGRVFVFKFKSLSGTLECLRYLDSYPDCPDQNSLILLWGLDMWGLDQGVLALKIFLKICLRIFKWICLCFLPFCFFFSFFCSAFFLVNWNNQKKTNLEPYALKNQHESNLQHFPNPIWKWRWTHLCQPFGLQTCLWALKKDIFLYFAFIFLYFSFFFFV